LSGKLSSVPLINTLFAPLQRVLFGSSQYFGRVSESSLQKENSVLLHQIIQYKQQQKDDAALRDQFQTSAIPTTHLLPAHIIAEPGFIPGQTAVEDFLIDQGSKNGIKDGMAVVYKDNLLGRVIETTTHVSHVVLVSNGTVSFAAKTLSSDALGVVKGQGGGDMLLDNVTLSQTLKNNDIVVTSGDMDMHGIGYPPNLVVGKIVSVQKDPSALFQRAHIVSLADITGLSLVFVYTITN